MKQTKSLFAKLRRPLSSKDLECHLDMPLAVASQTLTHLEKVGCIEMTHGNVRTGRFFMWIEGKELPPDGRGKHPNSRSALRAKASRSHAEKTGHK